MVLKAGERTIGANLIDTDGERIHSVFGVGNPDKLNAIALANRKVIPAGLNS